MRLADHIQTQRATLEISGHIEIDTDRTLTEHNRETFERWLNDYLRNGFDDEDNANVTLAVKIEHQV